MILSNTFSSSESCSYARHFISIRTKNGQKFLDGVRQCCVELLAMNVATTQVEPVIRSVLLNIAGIEVDALPKSSTLSSMLIRLKIIKTFRENVTLMSCKLYLCY